MIWSGEYQLVWADILCSEYQPLGSDTMQLWRRKVWLVFGGSYNCVILHKTRVIPQLFGGVYDVKHWQCDNGSWWLLNEQAGSRSTGRSRRGKGLLPASVRTWSRQWDISWEPAAMWASDTWWERESFFTGCHSLAMSLSCVLRAGCRLKLTRHIPRCSDIYW